jgi:parallel beta-helix repeat protein
MKVAEGRDEEASEHEVERFHGDRKPEKHGQKRSEQSKTTQETNHRVGSKVAWLRGAAARKSRIALVTALIAAGLVLPPLAAGLVAPPAHASTTFTVTNTNDSGEGSLKQAILDANSNPGADVIEFGIPGTGVQTIVPATGLPTITERVTIDGYSQQGAHPNTKTVGDDASIQLDGKNAVSNGLVIHNASNCVIRGLAINRFSTGISMTGLDDSVGNRIEGNFIGASAAGTSGPGNSLDGVFVFGPSEAVIGGSKPEKRNLIAGNDQKGVELLASDSSHVQGNYVGTDRNGELDSFMGSQGQGIRVESSSGVTVGGNVISGNLENGLAIEFSDGTKVLGNRIGTNPSGLNALGNLGAGIQIVDSSTGSVIGDGTAAGSNIIAFNRLDGVEVDATSTGNTVSRNSVFSNGGLGMDLLGPGEDSATDISSPNDADDKDTGANNLQNRPAITSARTATGKTTIKGRLNSTPNQTFTIRFYANLNGTNEGKKFLGQKSVTAKADGSVSFAFSPATTVAAGQTITATATRVSSGDTSEFSPATPRAVVTS